MELKNYHTKQKDIVLNILREHKDEHLTIQAMLDIIENANLNVSKATLYRQVDLLVLSGVIKRYDLGSTHEACYQYVSDNNCLEHFHLYCLECGSIIHMECDIVNDFISHIEKSHAFNVDKSKMVFYGLCKKCQEAKN